MQFIALTHEMIPSEFVLPATERAGTTIESNDLGKTPVVAEALATLDHLICLQVVLRSIVTELQNVVVRRRVIRREDQ